MGKLKKKKDSDFSDDEKPQKKGKGLFEPVALTGFAAMAGSMTPERFEEMLKPLLKDYDEKLQKQFQGIIGHTVGMLDSKISEVSALATSTKENHGSQLDLINKTFGENVKRI